MGAQPTSVFGVSSSCQALLSFGFLCGVHSQRSMYCYNQIFDAHNGPAAAMYCKEHLLNNVMNAIPSGPLTREEWLAALPRAMVAGFVKTDSDFQKHGR